MTSKFKLYSILISVLILPYFLFSTDYDMDFAEPCFAPTFNFYSDNHLSVIASGRGYTGVASRGDLSLALINPASLELDKNKQFYFEHGIKNDIDWMKDYMDDIRVRKYKPGNVYGFGMRIKKNIQFGIMYSKSSSYHYDIEKLYYYDYSIDKLDSLHFQAKVSISSVSIPITYSYKNHLKVGLIVFFNQCVSENHEFFYNQYGVPLVVTGKVNFILSRIKLGMLITPFKNFDFGISYLLEESDMIIKDVGSLGRMIYTENTFPMELIVGATYRLRKIPVIFLFDYKNSNDSKYFYLENQNNFHFGIEFFYKENIIFRSGFFTQFDYRNLDAKIIYDTEEENYWFDDSSYDQYFITFGFSYLWKILKFNFSIMDSHLFSPGTVKQTYINSGLSIDF